MPNNDNEIPTKHITSSGVEWMIGTAKHRRDGPAVEYADGSEIWCLYDLIHRKDGPAITHSDGCVEYWIAGYHYTDIDKYCQAAELDIECAIEFKLIYGKAI